MTETILTSQELALVKDSLVQNLRARMITVGQRTSPADKNELDFIRWEVTSWIKRLDRLDVIQTELNRMWKEEQENGL